VAFSGVLQGEGRLGWTKRRNTTPGTDQPDRVLFGTDRTASTPLMYAMPTDTSTVEAGASYADRKAVVLQ
jgi:hypothetical protein